MSGIDRIIEKIVTQANTQAENEILHVQSKIEKKSDEQQHRFERTMEAEITHATLKGEEEYKRVIASAMLECRKNILKAKVETINEVFDKALTYLTSLNEKDYLQFLYQISNDLLLDGGNQIIMNKNDKKAVGEKLIKMYDTSKKVSLSDETIKSQGGLIIQNGLIQTNLTFEATLRMEKEKLESKVVTLLFEGS